MAVSILVMLAFVAVPPAEYASYGGIVDDTEGLGLVAADTPDEDLEAVHERGVTGEGTRVGVVGAAFGSQATVMDGVADRTAFYRSG
ncbi:MAG: hypothetical protein V5A46_05360, partial [Haloferacaceae archaeon]